MASRSAVRVSSALMVRRNIASSGSRLEGMVFDRFEGTPPLPRILSGVFHPRGVLITVKYDDMESLEGPGPGR
jgi:hypothetical protein